MTTTTAAPRAVLLQGNEAAAEGAITAGAPGAPGRLS